MACMSTPRRNETLIQRAATVKAATARLEAAIARGAVSVKLSPQGAITFVGWAGAERDDVSDVCAYRLLTAAGSSVLRMAVARAEGLAGRKVNPAAIAAGVHSHDGGQTWGRH